jgi:DnaJ-domain-containing protein 1
VNWRLRIRSSIKRLDIPPIRQKLRSRIYVVQEKIVQIVESKRRLLEDHINRSALFHLNHIRTAYARLEVPFGSDLTTVRKAYRRLMFRYHPDRHVTDPECERLATQVSQGLTVSYSLLEKHLSGEGFLGMKY